MSTSSCAPGPASRADAVAAAAADVLRETAGDDLLTQLCRQAWRLAGGDRAVVAVPDGGEFVVAAADGSRPIPRGARGAGSRVPVAGTVAGVVLRSGEPALVPDTAGHPLGALPINGAEGIRGSLVVPLRDSRDRVIGVLSVFASAPGAVDEHGLARLQELVRLLSVDGFRLPLALSEAAARTSADGEQLYRAVLESLGEGVVVHGREGQVLLHNQVAADVLGLTPAELAGRALLDPRWHMLEVDGTRLAAEDYPAARALRAGVGERGRLLLLRRPDGQERVVSVTSLPRKDAAGRTFSAVVSFSDVTDQHRLAERSHEQARRLAAAMQLADLATWETTLGTDDWEFSDALRAVFGLPASTHLDESVLRRCFGEATWAHLYEVWAQVLGDRQPRQVTAEVVMPDGSARRTVVVWLDLTCDDEGVPVKQWGVVQDVTERVEAVRTLAENEEVFRLTFDRAPIGMLMLDLVDPGRVLRSNGSFRAMTRRPGRDDTDDPLTMADWTAQSDLPRCLDLMRAFQRGEVEQDGFEMTCVRPDGSTFEALVTMAMARDGQGRPLHVVAHVLDVSERLAQGRELERLALTDGLTGLANRRAMEQRLTQALAEQPARGGLVGLVLLDLDHFKVVNDSLGHATGDALLVEVAGRLRSTVRACTTVARLGGDEFVAVVDDARSFADVEAVAERLLACLREPFRVGSGRMVATASLGLAVSDGGGSPAELLREADLALYRAKATGRDRLVRFDAELRTRADARLQTESMLRQALAEDRLELHLQPVVDLADGRPAGAEALVRIRHPGRGLVPPGEFISVAEECGLITEVDTWVLRRAVELLAVSPGLQLSINASARTLESGTLPQRVADLLARHDVAPGRLHLEITETSLLGEGTVVADVIRRLRATGCQVGLDDFGTGYSALSYLQALELDFLKIDRSFIGHLGEGPRHDAVVKAVVDLAHAHRLDVVAEGVETEQQRQLLRAMGCDRAQGWLFGRPAAP
ncbi:bifunctional diguanylate cyclase/phosphodiesterase [Aquipuribacter sp. MA13-6]|uniref:bifunctional diguanylate cyclase/phosphodiesterase n=1 Tax=unclassified Aquipuribacter TaxID=2635084 RepID=UPI003EEA1DC5